MNKFIFSIGLLVFVLSVAWILDDFGVISLRGHSQGSASSDVGLLAKKIKTVQRRGKNSLSWDDIGQEEKVFTYDSVMTMNQSGALLKMNEGVDLNMDENTLITILPPEDHFDALTLNLMAGSYKMVLAKGKRVRVHGVLISAKEDSKVQFTSGKDSQTYLSVASGAVEVSNKNQQNSQAVPVGVVKPGQDVIINNAQGVAKVNALPVAKVEPVPPQPTKKIVSLPKSKAKRKIAQVKPRVKVQHQKTVAQKHVHKHISLDGPGQHESMDRRADPEAMSQELGELPGN